MAVHTELKRNKFNCASYCNYRCPWKWKDIVDEWVKLNQPGEHILCFNELMADGDSPEQKVTQNGYHQVPAFAYSPNPHNGSSRSDKNNSESEPKPKVIPRKEAPPSRAAPVSTSAHQNRQRKQQKKDVDSENWLQQEKGFKRITKKLKIVHLFSFLLLL